MDWTNQETYHNSKQATGGTTDRAVTYATLNVGAETPL